MEDAPAAPWSSQCPEVSMGNRQMRRPGVEADPWQSYSGTRNFMVQRHLGICRGVFKLLRTDVWVI